MERSDKCETLNILLIAVRAVKILALSSYLHRHLLQVVAYDKTEHMTTDVKHGPKSNLASLKVSARS